MKQSAKILAALTLLLPAVTGCMGQTTITTNGVPVAPLPAPSITLAFTASPSAATEAVSNVLWWGTNSGAYLYSEPLGTNTSGAISNNLTRGAPWYFNVEAQCGAAVAFGNEVTNAWPAAPAPDQTLHSAAASP